MKLILTLALLFILTALPCYSADKEFETLKLVESGRSLKNIYHGNKNLTGFTHPHEIVKYQTSPNGKWAFIWHYDYPPMKLRIYNMQKDKLIKDFEPGYGGGLRWTAYNDLVHSWGCGSSCTMMAIYDIQGRTIFSGVYNKIDFSPGNKYMATFPMIFGPDPFIYIYDLKDLKQVYKSSKDDNYEMLFNIEWEGDETLNVLYDNTNNEPQTLTIRLKPAKQE